MLPTTEKDTAAIEKAKALQNVPWGDEYERMISGMIYSPIAPELVAGRERARRLLAEINAPPQPDVAYSETLEKRDAALRKLFGKIEGGVYIEPPLFVDYGCNVSAGSFYANFGLTILDCGLVTIGHSVEIGPNVNIITGEHHTDINLRRANWGKEFTRPVTIGSETWIGANVTILAGVTIGRGCTIGAGAVVKGDIPDFSIAVGVPARVVKSAGVPEGDEPEGAKKV
ncbi:trimeric LpxA-like protein [Aspergillus germanicus]